MTHYTMPARPQGELYAQRRLRAERDTHRWVFVHSPTPEVESAVRKWLVTRLIGFYCDLQAVYNPKVRSTSLARTHIVLDDTHPLHTMAKGDEAVEVDASGSNARDAAKAVIEATGLNPHLSVCGWPFCLGDLDDAHNGGGEV